MTEGEMVEAIERLRAEFATATQMQAKQNADERAEIEARHQAEVARVQANSSATRALHERSVAASEALAAAMTRIATALEAR